MLPCTQLCPGAPTIAPLARLSPIHACRPRDAFAVDKVEAVKTKIKTRIIDAAFRCMLKSAANLDCLAEICNLTFELQDNSTHMKVRRARTANELNSWGQPP